MLVFQAVAEAVSGKTSVLSDRGYVRFILELVFSFSGIVVEAILCHLQDKEWNALQLSLVARSSLLLILTSHYRVSFNILFSSPHLVLPHYSRVVLTKRYEEGERCRSIDFV